MNDQKISSTNDLAIFGGSPTRPQPIETGVLISDHARDRVNALLDCGQLSNYHNGPWARQFEEEFAKFHGPEYYAIAVNSGTSALHLAVTAANVGPGDEVIVPALCFVAAATAVVQNGGIPVICDAEPKTLTMDIAKAESLISSRTKAILVVHFWGYPTNVAALRELCDRHGLALIEDCAQALGAPAHGRKVGNFGDYATFAFSVRKHIACGEGGIVLCSNKDSYEHIRRLSNYGKGPGWDDYFSIGYNYRMAEFQAIIALDGLSRLDLEIQARSKAGSYYRELLRDTELDVVQEPTWGKSVFFKCPVLLPTHFTSERQKIVDAISTENISCRIPHRPLYSIPWLAEYLKEKGAYRGADGCPTVAVIYPQLFEIETGPYLPEDEARVSGAALLKVWRHFCSPAPPKK
ncbi:MAG: DegT/DnrJ/EryC1/StrS family aminotransferase [Desulfatitalea sp.]|nr:DegT/DnrJ/EryC1/StrS family aminotransferase [Desulfatitalea sp.]NNJ99530.1 DegT/DnrJ/EryC1/StrS family aminotransferase [Desulfatitalea sp.]